MVPAPNVSSQLESTSAILGEYMLKGWTLTDLHCEICRVTPLMREPLSSAEREGRDRIQFCALCDGGPAPQLPPLPITSRPSHVAAGSSSGSDDVASSISALMLQGYSLLASNCPNSTCPGIPMVGYPRRKDGSRDSRRTCVGCGGRWVQGGDLRGMTVMGGGVKVEKDKVQDKRPAQEEEGSPRTRRRREMYGIDLDERQPTTTKLVDPQEEEEAGEGGLEVDAGKAVSLGITERARANALPTVLGNTAMSLSLTLERLASSLERHTTGAGKIDEARHFVEVKLHTEAMKDVLEVLGMVERVST